MNLLRKVLYHLKWWRSVWPYQAGMREVLFVSMSLLLVTCSTFWIPFEINCLIQLSLFQVSLCDCHSDKRLCIIFSSYWQIFVVSLLVQCYGQLLSCEHHETFLWNFVEWNFHKYCTDAFDFYGQTCLSTTVITQNCLSIMSC